VGLAEFVNGGIGKTGLWYLLLTFLWVLIASFNVIRQDIHHCLMQLVRIYKTLCVLWSSWYNPVQETRLFALNVPEEKSLDTCASHVLSQTTSLLAPLRVMPQQQ